MTLFFLLNLIFYLFSACRNVFFPAIQRIFFNAFSRFFGFLFFKLFGLGHTFYVRLNDKVTNNFIYNVKGTFDLLHALYRQINRIKYIYSVLLLFDGIGQFTFAPIIGFVYFATVIG